ncbi:MAG: hypothetical protein M3Q79_04195 [bacterium]|nr:hypothetical protein [bacterium]
MNPNQKIFREDHAIQILTDEAMASQELGVLGSNLAGLRVEGQKTYHSSEATNVGKLLDLIGSPRNMMRLMTSSDPGSGEDVVNYTPVEILPPYEEISMDDFGIAKIKTSLVRVDLHDMQDGTIDSGKNTLVMFILTPDGRSVRPDSLEVGKNFRYAALLRDFGNDVEFFRYEIDNGERVLYSEQDNYSPFEDERKGTLTMQYNEPATVVKPVETYTVEYYELVDEMKKAVDFYKAIQVSEPDEVKD